MGKTNFDELEVGGKPVATREYTDTAIAAAGAGIKGNIDCSANPNYPAAVQGDRYRVSVAGKIGGASGVVVEVGDTFTCFAATSAAGTQAAVGANWTISQANIPLGAVGKVSSFSKATTGPTTMIPMVPVDRVLTGTIEITETFADGDGAKPIFNIGQDGTLNKFKAALNAGTVGDVIPFSGVLTANTDLLVSATPATGTTSTGAIKVTAIAAPAL